MAYSIRRRRRNGARLWLTVAVVGLGAVGAAYGLRGGPVGCGSAQRAGLASGPRAATSTPAAAPHAAPAGIAAGSAVTGAAPQVGSPASGPTGAAGAPSPGLPAAEGDEGPATEKPSKMEQRAFDLVNALRRANRVEPLSFAEDLLPIARGHSERMATEGFFDHRDPDGKTVADRVTDAGIEWTKVAENIASNQGHEDPPKVAADGWAKSEGHRRNILDGDLTEAALGVAKAEDDTYYFTQVFVRRQ
jgi:uncharacterized protein YkwD